MYIFNNFFRCKAQFCPKKRGASNIASFFGDLIVLPSINFSILRNWQK